MRSATYGQNGRRMGGRRRNKSEEQRQRERYLARGQSALRLRPNRPRKAGTQPKLGMEDEAKKTAEARRRARARSEPPKKSRSRSKSKSKPRRSPSPRRRSPVAKRRRTPSPAPQPPRGRSPSPVVQRRPVRERDRAEIDAYAQQGAAIGARRAGKRSASTDTLAARHRKRHDAGAKPSRTTCRDMHQLSRARLVRRPQLSHNRKQS